ncbi:Haloacid dehydrogenase incomplete domain containing protein [Pandoravirus celtis]|uniref:Haloacid dehydrogenase incomplete domain containing protein n=1 Tax=Pandoravirus celtis TaxID=2568002 RepID=A0A4D6EFK4_9VIRU|nr:Haloacid dehydrogenase incomplete domain containing protein [Pandoravirus celtis]
MASSTMADRPPLPLPPTDAGPVSFVQTAAAAIDGAVALALSTLVTASRTFGNRNDNNDAERYMTGGAYDLALDRAVADGYRAIHARLSTLHANATASGGPAPLVVFDVDDTLLSTRSGHRLQPTVTTGSYATARCAFLPPSNPSCASTSNFGMMGCARPSSLAAGQPRAMPRWPTSTKWASAVGTTPCFARPAPRTLICRPAIISSINARG